MCSVYDPLALIYISGDRGPYGIYWFPISTFVLMAIAYFAIRCVVHKGPRRLAVTLEEVKRRIALAALTAFFLPPLLLCYLPTHYLVLDPIGMLLMLPLFSYGSYPSSSEWNSNIAFALLANGVIAYILISIAAALIGVHASYRHRQNL